MMCGELAEHSVDYQNGHNTGSVRAYDDAIMHFKTMSKKRKFTPEQVAMMLKQYKGEWMHHCETCGMGNCEA